MGRHARPSRRRYHCLRRAAGVPAGRSPERGPAGPSGTRSPDGDRAGARAPGRRGLRLLGHLGRLGLRLPGRLRGRLPARRAGDRTPGRVGGRLSARRAGGRTPRPVLGRLLAVARRALVCLAWCSGGNFLWDFFQEPAPEPPPAAPRVLPLDQPPPGHPERLVSDQPLSPAEAGLWQQILSDDPAG
jgi:hypothetical protein